MYTLLEAAKATGRNKTTVLRAIKSGKISATRTDAGNYQIDPAELHRVYTPATAQPDAKAPEATERTSEPDAMRGKALAYRTLAKQQQQRLVEQAETIADLRSRLDREQAERQRTSAQLAGLLTHQAEQERKRRWWPW